MDNNQAIIHVKLSEINDFAKKAGKNYIRVTGKLDNCDPMTRLAKVYSLEGKNDERDELFVNLSLLDNFNQQDLNAKHDLLQFVGHLTTMNDDSIQLKAIYCRVIKRIPLQQYYKAIDIQRDYLRDKGYLKKDENFLF